MENKKIEPLLKDEVETFPFLEEQKNNSKKSKRKLDKATIMTVILTFIIISFFGRMLYAFYMGFKFYDLRFATNEPYEVTNEEEIPLDSAIVTETYEKININNENNLVNLFYNGSELLVENLDENQKITILLSSLPELNCLNPEVIINYEELARLAEEIFGDYTLIENLRNFIEMSYDNFLVSYDSLLDSYIVTLQACNDNEDFIIRNITKASTNDDELYIYESFGYFKHLQELYYNVYPSTAFDNVITEYKDINENHEFTDTNILATYKWTFKKGSDNSYYFISLTHI